MAYDKTYWTNDTGQALDATALNHMEQGIDDAHKGYIIKALYEEEWDTNAYTDAEKAIVAGIASGSTDHEERITQNESDISTLEVANIANESDIVVLESSQASQDITLTAHGARLLENEDNISNLGDDLGYVEDELVAVEGRVTALESVALPFTPFWVGSRHIAVALSLDTYVEVNRITTGVLEAGTYGFIHTAVSHYDTVTRSGYCRISPDGGTTWVEFNNELKDITDKNLMTCSNFIVLAVPGVIDIIVEGRCEQTGDLFTINNTVLQLERKL